MLRRVRKWLFFKVRGLKVRLARLKKQKDGTIPITVMGRPFFVGYDDAGLAMDLIADGKREYLSTEKMLDLIQPGDVVLDIGANIGYYVLIEAIKTGPSGLIYAVEPTPYSYNILMKNVRSNMFDNVILSNIAFSDKQGEATLYVHEKRNLNAFTMSTMSEVIETIKVKTDTVDSFLKERRKPSVLRMDVEGAEDKILDGAVKLLEGNDLRAMFIELHPHLMGLERTRNMLRRLRDSRFEVLSMFDGMSNYIRESARFLKETNIYSYKKITLADMIDNPIYLEGRTRAYELFITREVLE